MKTSSKILMAISGIFLIIGGIAIMANPDATLVSIAWVLGISIMAAGISTFCFWIVGGRLYFGGPTVLFAAIGEFLIGIFMFANSLIIAGALPFIFGIWILVKGIDVAVRSFDYKKVGFKLWWINLIIGIIAAILGVLSFTEPARGASLISLCLGLGIILDGIHYIVALFGIGKFEKNVRNIKAEIEGDSSND